jgi:hypothetical protein
MAGCNSKEFREVISKKITEDLKKQIKSGTIFNQRSKKSGTVSITIPKAPIPGLFVKNELYGIPQEPVKKQRYRSIDEPFEPAW